MFCNPLSGKYQMKLKTITLITAIVQLIAGFCGLFETVPLFFTLSWSVNKAFFVFKPIYLAAHIMIAVFLFTLAFRQKNN